MLYTLQRTPYCKVDREPCRPCYRLDSIPVHNEDRGFPPPTTRTATSFLGNPHGVRCQHGLDDEYEDNALGWLEKVTYADDFSTQHEYNGLGYLTNTIDRAGRITDYTYAPTKKLTSVKRHLDPDGTNAPHPVCTPPPV